MVDILKVNAKKVFLSYAREDSKKAEQIFNDLTKHGIDVWFDKISIDAGQKWQESIEKGIEQSELFIVLLSKNSVSKTGFIQKEIRIALEKFDLYPPGKSFVIPVRLDNCKPEHLILNKLQWLDLFPPRNYENGLKKILRRLQSDSNLLRSIPKRLSHFDMIKMIQKNGFYDSRYNPDISFISRDYQEVTILNELFIVDNLYKLMWQASGSAKIDYDEAKNYINRLNEEKHGGFSDWRLPTLEQATSLVSPTPNDTLMFIDIKFNNKQRGIWTSDRSFQPNEIWIVSYSRGSCRIVTFDEHYVRAVRRVDE